MQRAVAAAKEVNFWGRGPPVSANQKRRQSSLLQPSLSRSAIMRVAHSRMMTRGPRRVVLPNSLIKTTLDINQRKV